MKPTINSRLPMRVSAQILLARRVNDEPLVVLMVHGVGTTAPYEFRDDEGRDYICRWENKLGAHVIRIPASLWAANNHKMARSCMERRRQQFPLVVGIELAEQSAGAGGVAVGLGQADAPPLIVEVPDFEVEDTVEPVVLDPVEIKGVPLAHVIAAAVADGAMRVKSLVVTIGGDITEDQVKQAVLPPDSGLSLKNGWVSLSDA